jgi:acyl dehydratase
MTSYVRPGTAGTSPAAEGPYFDELGVGQEFATAPGITLTPGLAAAHQAITGDRLALTLDQGLCREVAGAPGLAPPSLAWDIAIGQSTVVTQQVKANLFYRGLAFRRLPRYLDTLRTTTRIEALRQNRPREGRAPTGLAVLRITTTDQDERPVLDFWRCAMLPLRDPAAQTGHADDLDAVGQPIRAQELGELVADWRLLSFARRTGGPRLRALEAGQSWDVAGGDVVTGAAELARLTLNVAAVHHDAAAAGGQRLVYGGHVIGLALSQACRSLPSIVTVAGWHSCDHLGPVREGDTVRSRVTIERVDPLPSGGGLVHLRSQVRALAPEQAGAAGQPGSEPRDVLDWRYVAIIA